jgi:hypothetical protein
MERDPALIDGSGALGRVDPLVCGMAAQVTASARTLTGAGTRATPLPMFFGVYPIGPDRATERVGFNWADARR